MNHPNKISPAIIAIYGLPQISLALIGYPLTIYLIPFYSGELGLPLAVLGTMLFLGRLTDIITDPIIGILSDRTRLKSGRRKVWMLAGAFVMTLGVYKLFTPVSPVDIWYFIIWLSVVFFGFTLIGLPYAAWGAEISPEYHVRTRFSGSAQFCMVIGLLLATTVPTLVPMEMTHAVTREAHIMTVMSYMVYILLPLGILMTLIFIPDRVPPHREENIPFGKGLKIMWHNGPFKRVVLAMFIAYAAENFRLTITYFFARDVVGMTNIETMYLFYFLFALTTIPAWVWMANRFGKHIALSMGLMLMVLVGIGMLFLKKGDTTALFVLFCIKGLGFGALNSLPAAIIADIVDIDELRSKEQRQGLYYSIYGFVFKLGIAFGAGLAPVMLALVNFDAAGASSTEALLWVKLYYGLIPGLLLLITLKLLWGYPITRERHKRIQERVQRIETRLAN